MLEIANPYLGDMAGVWSDWSPLKERNALFPEEFRLPPIPGSSKISACSKRRRAHNAGMITALIRCLLLCLIAVPVRAADTKEAIAGSRKPHQTTIGGSCGPRSKAAGVRAGLKELQQKLITRTAALVEKQQEQEGLEERQAQLAADIAAKTAELAGERRKLGMLTAAMVELGRQPARKLFPGRYRPHLDLYVDRAIVLRAIVPRVKEQAEAIATISNALDDLKTQE